MFVDGVSIHITERINISQSNNACAGPAQYIYLHERGATIRNMDADTVTPRATPVAKRAYNNQLISGSLTTHLWNAYNGA